MAVKYKPPFKEDDTIYEITVADVLEVAGNLGIPPEQVTDTVIMDVQHHLDVGLQGWTVAVEAALNDRLVVQSQN